MDKKYKIILLYLLENDYVTTQELSICLRKTNRTTRTYLKELNQLLNVHGARIVNIYSKGNHLEILNEIKFMNFYSNENNKPDYNHQDNRITEILSFLFFRREYIKEEELIDCFYISQKQMKEDMKKMKTFLLKNNLKIKIKPYYGISIQGNEFNKRMCILKYTYTQCHYFLSYNIEDYENRKESIHNIVTSCLDNKNFYISEDNLADIVQYITLSTFRFMDGYFVEQQIFDDSSLEYQISLSIIKYIQKVMSIKLDQTETVCLAIQLLSKGQYMNRNQYVSEELNQLIQDMLLKIKEHFGIIPVNDFDLMISLSKHLDSLLTRIKYRTFLHNQLTQEIKEKLYKAYEISIIACEVINEKYHVILPEDEIAYIALYIDLVYEYDLQTVSKKNILIICSSGLGTSRLLKTRFERMFSHFLNRIDVETVSHIKFIDMNYYDFIFTTVHLDLKTDIPIIKIDNIICEDDYEKIERHLSHRIIIDKYLNKKRIFLKIDANNKKECLEYMIRSIKDNDQIPENFSDLVMKRERLGTTEFGNILALTHPLYPITQSSFIAIGILKRPIIWNENKIRIVLLMSVGKNVSRIEMDEVYHIVSVILANKVIQNKMIHEHSVEILFDYLVENI